MDEFLNRTWGYLSDYSYYCEGLSVIFSNTKSTKKIVNHPGF